MTPQSSLLLLYLLIYWVGVIDPLSMDLNIFEEYQSVAITVAFSSSNCPIVSQWALLHVGSETFDMSLVVFDSFLAIWL